MCGIAGIHVKDSALGRFPIDRMADPLLARIEHRGKEATGFVAVNDNGDILHEKAPVTASDFIKNRQRIPADTRTLLMHTRLATQGKPEDNENNHPVRYETCYATHNGIIRNDEDVFKKLELARTAEVDSIAIPAAFAYHGFGDEADIRDALEELTGLYAIAAIDPTQKLGRVVLAKGPSSPLWVLNHPKAIVWASTKSAIEDAWGAILGTPPKRKANFKGGKAEFGIEEIPYGWYWIIDGDNIQTGEFRPYTQTYGRSSGQHSFRDARTGGSEDDDYLGTGWGTRSILDRPRREWTCKPTFKNCEHPCVKGCSTGFCECWTGNPDHPRETAVRVVQADDTQGNGTARSLSLVRKEDAGRVADRRRGPLSIAQLGELGSDEEIMECDGCSEFFRMEHLTEYPVGGKNFDLCDSCMDLEGGDPDVEQEPSIDELAPHVRAAIKGRAIAELSFELDTNAKFINWLLFEASDEDFAQDQYLSGIRKSIQREYAVAERIATRLETGVG